jgi:hypothetical protein
MYSDEDVAALYTVLNSLCPRDAFYPAFAKGAPSVLDVGCETGTLLHHSEASSTRDGPWNDRRFVCHSLTMNLSDATFDVTARKFHQSVTVVILILAFVIGGPMGTVLVALDGVVMLVGRYWWPADIFRQLTWRVLEPAGILRRNDVQEDHETRRVARVMGGIVFLAGAAILAAGGVLAWIAIAAIAVMITLDALFNFCVLCAITYHAARFAHR